MNVQLNYLYRDAANYKNYGAVVFTNSSRLSLATIEEVIRLHLIEGEWFVAAKWKLPDLHFTEFAWDDSIDHDWHEYSRLEVTEEACTINMDIQDFLRLIATGVK